MSLKRVRLELARDAEFPEGSPNHGYEFNIPLLDDGSIDVANLRPLEQLCTVVHFWGNRETEHGQIVSLPNGQWAFSYAVGEDDDEPIYHMTDHLFRQGEYVSITDHSGVARTFRVVSVDTAVHPAKAEPAA